MTQNNWTPGPWDSVEERVYFRGVGGISLHGCRLGEKAEPTARLIAAAPDLHEALLLARKALHNVTMDGQFDETKAAIRAALAKAEGAAL